MKMLGLVLPLLCLVSLIAACNLHAEPVGIAGQRNDVFLPGPELEVRPLQTGKDSLDLRIVAVYAHGTAGFRYDLEFIGYEPGTLNLSDALRPTNGASAVPLPPIEVEISSALPAGIPGALNTPSFDPKRIGSGYFVILFLFVTAWLGTGLLLLASWIRSKRKTTAAAPQDGATPADQLRLLIQQALNDGLDGAGKAELERRVLGFWRERLHLSELPPLEAMKKIREHEEAGRLLLLIENWLHNPNSRVSESDVNQALAPYEKAS